MEREPLKLLISVIQDEVTEPRVDRTRRHDLEDIIIMAVLACICGANGWKQVAAFCRLRAEWFEQVLSPAGGIPSADTFRRVICRIIPEELQRVFVRWTALAVGTDESGHIAIDGKTARRSGSAQSERSPLHLVSAWATDLGVVLAQRATDVKSNEITAIPELLDALKLRGATVTIDAIGCQREIARKIRGKQGDYILQVKGNQPQLLQDVSGLFDEVGATPEHAEGRIKTVTHETVDGDHGRIERRQVTVTDEVSWLRKQNRWAGIRSIVMVERERETKGNKSEETSYYITSLPADAEDIGQKVREHWHIENRLHWVLDMAFREDESRIRTGNGAENIAMLRKVTLNLLRMEKTAKCGLELKRQQAGWSGDYTVLRSASSAATSRTAESTFGSRPSPSQLADELDQGADDPVKPRGYVRWQLADVAQRASDLEARECFASRPERVVETRLAVLAPAIGTLRRVQSDAGSSTAQLPTEIGVAARDPPDERSQRADGFENERIDGEHGNLLRLSSPSPNRPSQVGSRLRRSAAEHRAQRGLAWTRPRRPVA